MRIGVIGGGGAGLTTAWLLEEHHDVMLFERDERLGGHAHTVDVEVDGQRLQVDAGFEFFGGSTYPTFTRLLDAIGVPRRSYPATFTLTGGGGSIVLPPVRGGMPAWRSLGPASVAHLLRLRRFAAGIPAFMLAHDTSITMREHLDRLRLPPSFRDEFLVPFLLGFWCVELDEFLETSAYNTLFYLAAMTGWRAPMQFEIDGGMRTYVDALTRDLRRTDVRVACGIRRISRPPGGFAIDDARGRTHEFDQIVLAAPADFAAELLTGVPGLEERTTQLRRFEFFDAVIAIHGDRRLMPPRERDWSVVNSRWDGAHSQLSIWKPTRGLPLFRSWVTYEERMPEPLHELVRYRHGRGTPAHFEAQRRLAAMQGEHGVWLAGMYADDADSHESAVHSAVTVAERLAPESRRLGMLR
ncbi:FAD-dependent oxidoreductase [Microbacterium ulmi]|uniref:NAD(P)-binding protein n=1 Tax=Microbacterium ulmi TaxID=179095 RepID=A0A7Y2LZZ6_9MICO|nr:putative NAD/FAD-binding protein [Microbacterium ulmi]NNH03249.1 NAD(P)-binding protein [Microbacterium ulmi]